MDYIKDPSLVLDLPLWKKDGLSFMSDDAYGHLCTVTGALWRPDGRLFVAASSDKILYTGSLNLTDGGQMSSIIWCKPSGTGSMQLVGREAVNQEWHYYFTAGKLRVRGSGITAITSDNTITPDNWYCMGISFDGTAGVLYEQGLQVKSGTVDVFNDDPTKALAIGFITAGTHFDGTIGEVAIWNRTLIPLEFQNFYLATKGRYL